MLMNLKYDFKFIFNYVHTFHSLLFSTIVFNLSTVLCIKFNQHGTFIFNVIKTLFYILKKWARDKNICHLFCFEGLSILLKSANKTT